MKKISLLVVGKGNMSRAIAKSNIAGVEFTHLATESLDEVVMSESADSTRIAVHVGSGRLFPALVEYCHENKMPLIQASSSLKDRQGKEITLPATVEFPLIKAPNLALPVAALLRILPEFGGMMKTIGVKADVSESHQSTKKSAPITAQKIAGYFGFPPESVISIRDRNRQAMELQVPTEHLDGHAYHFVTLNSCGVEVSFCTKIHGRDAYVEGLGVLLRTIAELGGLLGPGIYQAEEILFS